jgi:hypothetical protein
MPVAAGVYSKKQVNKAGRLFSEWVYADPEQRATTDRRQLLEAAEAIQWWRSLHARPLAKVNAGLRYYTKQGGAAGADVTQRLKRFGTIVHKLHREPHMALSQMEDIGGVRAIVPSQQQLDRVRAGIERNWDVHRVRDYVAKPKGDGYRAVHVIVDKDGRRIEIQLRTPWQDSWAQSVEQDTRRLHSGLKFGAGPADLQEYWRAVSAFFEMREGNQDPDEEFMEHLARLYAATRLYFAEQPGDGAQ